MKMVKLGEIAEWGSGGTPRRNNAEYYGGEIPWLSIADLNDDYVVDAKECITDEGLKNSSAKIVPQGTLLVAMYGSIGKLGIAGRELCTSQAIAFAKVDPALADLRYVFHYMRSQREALQSRGRGGTQMNISQADLKQWPVPLPELEEQRRIAAILDKADEIRAKRQQMLDHLDDLTVALLGAELRNDTVATPAAKVLPSLRNGVSPSNKGEVLDEVLTLSAITRGRLNLKHRKTSFFDSHPETAKRVRDVDFLICRGNGNRSLVGAGVSVSGVDSEFVFPDTMIGSAVDTSIALPGFLELLWKVPPVRVQIEGAATTTNGTYKVNQKSLARVMLPLPSLAQQESFMRRVSRMNDLRESGLEEQTSLESLTESLRWRAFQGEL